MEKYYYIKLSAKNHFLCYDELLDTELFSVGETWQDYLDNKYVPLSEEQVAFREANPHATIKEVWEQMLLQPTLEERTLANTIEEKLADLIDYDRSSDVNSFSVVFESAVEEGQEAPIVSAWLTPEERANYRNSIDAAKVLGLETVSLYVADTPITITTIMAEQLLAQIQLYADQCFMVTKRHKTAIEALESIEAVNAYDFTTGYPLKLTFTI